MKIAVTGGKGGTGKSTVAASLAIEFAKRGKTMLVDADVECPNDYLILSVKQKKDSDVFQPMPKWDFDKCTKCGRCSEICKQNAIVFVKGRYPAFVQDVCIGCRACMVACPENAIGETKKKIGTIYRGKNYGVSLVTGELKIGELASGEIVAEVRKRSEELNGNLGCEAMLIDSAAGIGCPVIASIKGTDFVVAVTEPTPSALHDLRRVLHIADHFGIPYGVVINKHDLDRGFCSRIEAFAKTKKIPVLGRLPYSGDFVKSTVKMRPVTELNKEYVKTFNEIIENINGLF